MIMTTEQTRVAVTTDRKDTVKTCICADPEVDRLRDLIAPGFDQREASHLIWGDETRLTSWPLVRAAITRHVQRMADDLTRARSPWLRLPDRGR